MIGKEIQLQSSRSLTNLGITGTDTGVGKTVVTAAIIRALASHGYDVAPMKPVETGVAADVADSISEEKVQATGNFQVTPDQQRQQFSPAAAQTPLSDLELLIRASGKQLDPGLVRPVSFSEPLAPMVAMKRATGKAIASTTLPGAHSSSRLLATIDSAYQTLSSQHEIVVVEGAGGIYTPLTAFDNFATLFAKWRLNVIIVSANRLGAINHTMLTLNAAYAAGLNVKAIILNQIIPDANESSRPPQAFQQADVSTSTNGDAIRQLISAQPGPDIPVIEFPYITPSNLVKPENSTLLAATGSIILKHVL